MSDVRDFLARLVDALERTHVPYMLAGSVASTFHGTPRTTQDVDFVVDLDGNRLRDLLGGLQKDVYYFDEDAALDAVRRRAQFNIIDLDTGWKADLIVKKAAPFHREEFRRRMRGSVLGVDVWIASAEDTILSKLDWARRGGGSERQLGDVRGILLARSLDLDAGYIERWARDLGVLDDWKQLQQSQ